MKNAGLSLGVSLGSISRLSGGMFNSVRALSLHLKALDVVPTVYGVRDAWSQTDRPHWGEVTALSYPAKLSAKFAYSPDLQKDLLDADHDVLHQNGLWQGISLNSRTWARVKKRPVLISPRGMLDDWALRNSGFKKRIAARLYERENLLQASCIHALTEAERRSVRQFGYKGPIAVLPNGIDLPVTSSNVRAPWDGSVPATRKVMLYMSRIHPKKGLEAFFHALSGLPEDDWNIAIAGWGEAPYVASLQKMVRELRLSDKIIFTGPLLGKEKVAALQSASALVLPSYSEGLPMAVLEAWSFGLPVLMTEACNLNAPADVAITVSKPGPELRDGYLRLTSLSDSARREMGAAARKRAALHYSWPVIAAQTRQTYDWVLNGGPIPSWIDPGFAP